MKLVTDKNNVFISEFSQYPQFSGLKRKLAAFAFSCVCVKPIMA